jgi:DNA-directed RNA polymerase subunit RPC12/RpoP
MSPPAFPVREKPAKSETLYVCPRCRRSLSKAEMARIGESQRCKRCAGTA